MKISFIGLGKLGLNCAEVVADSGYYVAGYDIIDIKSDIIDVKKSVKECVENSDLIFISVPTPHESGYDGSYPTSHLIPKDFDYTFIKDTLAEINKFVNQNQTVVLISTVLPGTIREQLSSILTKSSLIYNPYFIAMGSVKWDMVNPDIVIIGSDNGEETEGVLRLINFYRSIMQNSPEYIVSNWEECECIKIFYNTFISTKLSFVNMIQDVAENCGNINVDVVTEALCRSEKRIISKQYMKSGMGDGGACHPRDNIALRFLSEKLNLEYDYFGYVMKMRELQAKNIAKKLVTLSKSYDMPIIIHGKSYKPGVPYTDGSYSILIGHYCEQMGVSPQYVDKYSEKVKINEPSVFLLAHNSKVTYNYLGDSKIKIEFYCNFPSNSIVLDLWRSYKSQDPTIKIFYYGNNKNKINEVLK